MRSLSLLAGRTVAGVRFYGDGSVIVVDSLFIVALFVCVFMFVWSFLFCYVVFNVFSIFGNHHAGDALL